MKLTNNEIYEHALYMQEIFCEADQKIPIKVNFYFQKNKNLLLNLAKEIEQERLSIIEKYQLNEANENSSELEENMELAKKDLLELLNLEQEVQIYKININDFPKDFDLTSKQMEILMFMIEE